MLACAATDDPRALTASWAALEHALRAHIAFEEETVLPGYAMYAPDDARQIREDHVRILALVTPLGVDIELHEVRLARLRELVTALEIHALHEDVTMYPWAANNLAHAMHELAS